MNAALLRQGADLLQRISDAQFTHETPLLPGGSIGRHLRHCLDFYASFLTGVPSGEIDYVHRERGDPRETDRTLALRAFRATIEALEAVNDAGNAPMLRVRAEEAPALSEDGWVLSTPAREVQFLASHTTHHYAIVAVFLRSTGFEPPFEFGVAPSTLRHWEAQRPPRAATSRIS